MMTKCDLIAAKTGNPPIFRLRVCEGIILAVTLVSERTLHRQRSPVHFAQTQNRICKRHRIIGSEHDNAKMEHQQVEYKNIIARSRSNDKGGPDTNASRTAENLIEATQK